MEQDKGPVLSPCPPLADSGETAEKEPVPTPTDDFLTVGRVLTSWGKRGEIKVQVLTDFSQRFFPQTPVYIRGKVFTIEESRWHKGHVLLKLNGVDDIEGAKSLAGSWVEIPAADAFPLEEGRYYHHQLIGLDVWTTQGRFLGKVAEVLVALSNDIYVVKTSGKEILIPAIEDVVTSIDLSKRIMAIEAIPGLLDE